MNYTKKNLENAILFFAKKFGKEKNYEAILSNDKSITHLVEMIVYEMFLNEFNSYHSTDEEFEQYKIIIKYAKELRENGFVNFK